MVPRSSREPGGSRTPAGAGCARSAARPSTRTRRRPCAFSWPDGTSRWMRRGCSGWPDPSPTVDTDHPCPPGPAPDGSSPSSLHATGGFHMALIAYIQPGSLHTLDDVVEAVELVLLDAFRKCGSSAGRDDNTLVFSI